MTVRSNIADLQALKKLAQPGYLYGRLATAAAGEALRLVQMGFRAGTDPDDSPWEPLKSRKGMILIRTARMRNSFTSRATARGFVVGSNVKYVTFHQDGTARSQSTHSTAVHVERRKVRLHAQHGTDGGSSTCDER